jgi:integrase
MRNIATTRHSFATNALKGDHSLNKISKALGHSDSRMVEKYAQHDVEFLEA